MKIRNAFIIFFFKRMIKSGKINYTNMYIIIKEYKMEERNNLLLSFFQEKNINYFRKKFVLAVSTGIDSSVLLDLFINFQKIYQNIEIIVCHVNHHRRSASEEEEQYIRDFCKDNNIKLFIEGLYFEDGEDNFQAKARELRYQFFDKIMKEEKADYLVLAHHGDDNIETILMRMTRGSSLIGYSGIQDFFEKESYYVIRPLLKYSKQDIINYQKMHKIKYYEDDSNSHKDYTRNRFRLDIIPKMKEECPNLVEKMYEFSNTLKNAGTIVNKVRDDFISQNVLKESYQITINRQEFLKLSTFLQEEVLFEIVKKDSLSKTNIKELIKIIKSNKVNYKDYFKNIFDFIIEYDKIIVNYIHSEDFKPIEVVINGLGTYEINDNFKVNVCLNPDKGVLKNTEICYNSNNLPVTIRTRKPGDKILLKTGEKKVKDLLINMKIPMSKRNDVFLLEKEGVILNIFGIRKSILLSNIENCDIIIKLEKK